MNVKTIFCVLVVFLLSYSCKKNCEEPTCSNISLINQPLCNVKHCLSGKWQLLYSCGGFSGDSIVYQNTYIDFLISGSGNDSLKWYNDTMVYSNGRLSFTKENIQGDNYGYVMNFPYQASALDYWFAHKIINDTLYIDEAFVSDGYIHTLARIE